MTFVQLRRNIGIAFGASVAFAVALGWWWFASALASWRVQHERLIEAAWSEERSAVPRSSHVPVPLPGTFGELLEPHLAALHESYTTYEQLGPEGMNQVMRICAGQDPIGRLGPEASADLARHRAAMQGALRATHARSGRGPASLRLFGALRPGHSLVDVQQAARLASLDVLTLVDRGRVDEAVRECADALALGRDVSYSSVLGRIWVLA